MAEQGIALNRQRFVVIALALGVAGAILVLRGVLDVETDPTSTAWKIVYVVAGVADLAVAGFFARIAVSPTLPVTEVGLAVPWFVTPSRREVRWEDVVSAEIGPARAFWSNKPVLRLKRTGKIEAEIPRSFVTEWDELLGLVRDKVGSVPNRFT